MTQYGLPMCYRCANSTEHTFNFVGMGEAGSCKEYSNGVPLRVFYEAGKCDKYQKRDSEEDSHE